MAEFDPNVPIVDDPELEANLVRDLSIIGRIGRLRVLDLVMPTISLGSVVQSTVEVRQASFRSTDVHSNGMQAAPAAGAVLADTGQLAAGIYDCIIYAWSNQNSNTARRIDIEHRNAANAANLAVWAHAVSQAGGSLEHTVWPPYAFGYEVATNERLRAITPVAGSAGTNYLATIFARLRT